MVSFYIATLLLCFSTLSLVKSSALNDIQDEFDYQHCACVPYWQCKEDYSGLINHPENAINILDIIDTRFAKRKNSIQDKSDFCTGDFDVCCRVECGKRRSTSTVLNRVFNSEESIGLKILGEDNQADFAEFPWMLGILKGRNYKCGGSLIHPSVALTAAHCVSSEATYKIRAGEWNWEDNTEPLIHQDRTSTKIIIHPDYHPGTLRHDIALLILNAPFKLAENIGLACIPHQDLLVDHTKCVATGWGKNSYRRGTYQATLKKVHLPIVSLDKCLLALQNARLGPRFRLHSSFLCAGGEAHKDMCKGDGGSPLMCPSLSNPEIYQQVGIVSWGLTCGLQNAPGVYVNVTRFSDWIRRQMLLHNFDPTVHRIR